MDEISTDLVMPAKSVWAGLSPRTPTLIMRRYIASAGAKEPINRNIDGSEAMRDEIVGVVIGVALLASGLCSVIWMLVQM